MAKVTENQANEKVRQNFLESLQALIEQGGDEAMQVATNAIAVPYVNELGTEIYLKITVSIPRGERGGPAYNGHEEHESYKIEAAEKARIKAQKIKDKEKAEAKRKAKLKETEAEADTEE